MNNTVTVATDTCTSIMPIIRIVRDGVIPLLQIGIPILLILFGMMDLGKAVMAGKEDEMKNAQKMLTKRAIYAIAVFLVVTIVSVAFGILAKSQDTTATAASASWSTCWNTP